MPRDKPSGFVLKSGLPGSSRPTALLNRELIEHTYGDLK